MNGPTKTDVILLGLNLILRQESKETLYFMFMEQDITDPDAYAKVVALAQDILEELNIPEE
jgi:hypothetical protein